MISLVLLALTQILFFLIIQKIFNSTRCASAMLNLCTVTEKESLGQNDSTIIFYELWPIPELCLNAFAQLTFSMIAWMHMLSVGMWKDFFSSRLQVRLFSSQFQSQNPERGGIHQSSWRADQRRHVVDIWEACKSSDSLGKLTRNINNINNKLRRAVSRRGLVCAQPVIFTVK